VRAGHGERKHQAGLDVGRAVKAAKVGVAAGGHSAVRALRAAHAKLEERAVRAHSEAVARGVGGEQRRVVAQDEQRRLEKLTQSDRTLDTEERNAGKNNAALLNSVELEVLSSEALEVHPELSIP